MAFKLDSIVKRYLILCEGIDTARFLAAYLESSALADDVRYSNDIQVLNFGGINDLDRFIRNLKNMEYFDDVSRLLVIRDAETDVQKAVQSVWTAFRKNNLPVPDHCNEWKIEGEQPATALTLLPTCTKEPVPGALEDLCWDILKHERIDEFRTDVQNFISSSIDKYASVSTHEHKSRVHTFFSVNEKLISLKIGEAADAGAFDWYSDKLQPLRDLIFQGFE